MANVMLLTMCETDLDLGHYERFLNAYHFSSKQCYNWSNLFISN